MTHLTDKPSGLAKLQRELKAAQNKIADLEETISLIVKENDELKEELEEVRKALSKKNKKDSFNKKQSRCHSCDSVLLKGQYYYFCLNCIEIVVNPKRD